MQKIQKFINQIIPFIFIGIALVAFAFGIFLLAYLFLIGAIVGFILFLISWLRQMLFPPKRMLRPKPKNGRIIDSDDWKKL